jgi:predicted RecA/RadA family phage recombinase
MKNYVYSGEKIDLAAPGVVTSGLPIMLGALFGVCQNAAKEGEDLVVITQGVFDLPKTSAQAWTVGQKVYWDSTNAVVSSTATGNTLIGVAIEVASNPSSIGRVRLNGTAV